MKPAQAKKKEEESWTKLVNYLSGQITDPELYSQVLELIMQWADDYTETRFWEMIPK